MRFLYLGCVLKRDRIVFENKHHCLTRSLLSQCHLHLPHWFSMGEKSENGGVPADLFNGLKVTDPQGAECAVPPVSRPKDHQPQSKLLEEVEAPPQEDQGEEERFHDCSASFGEEPGLDEVEDKPDDGGNSSEFDEEYLMELEKNMPDEEKQVSSFWVFWFLFF